MNFKYFIIGIYLTFISLIILMVFKSCGQNIELETKEYYAEELKYQSRIDAKELGNPYRDSFAVLDLGGQIQVRQPRSLDCDSAILEFRKPDKAAADRVFRTRGSLIEPVAKTEFTRGVYNLNIRVFNSRGEHLIEKKIKI